MSGEASLYFHIPFCTRKCPYCHFYVIPNKQEYHEQLLEALAREWQLAAPLLASKKLVSIYFGGGTPSLFGPKNIGTVLSWIRESGISLAEDCEITLEANPENLPLPLLQEYAAIGINRLSLGVQSLEDSSLLVLGREHNAQGAIHAMENAKRAGIDNISIDLMYDLPSQTEESWGLTLAQIERLPITHLSLYNLTIEPHTLFFKRKKSLAPLLPSPEASLSMLEHAISTLEAIGLKRYEISAFAREGFSSRHNTGYWTARPFLGLGPSAFSYWDKKRFRNVASLSLYAEALKAGRSPTDFSEELAYPQDVAELLAVQIRLAEGVDLAGWKLPIEMERTLQELQKKGWIERKGSQARLTREGMLFYDSVAEEIILETFSELE